MRHQDRLHFPHGAGERRFCPGMILGNTDTAGCNIKRLKQDASELPPTYPRTGAPAHHPTLHHTIPPYNAVSLSWRKGFGAFHVVDGEFVDHGDEGEERGHDQDVDLGGADGRKLPGPVLARNPQVHLAARIGSTHRNRRQDQIPVRQRRLNR